MKKVLSVVLAAAMVLGMSVSSFALRFDNTGNTASSNSDMTFGNSKSTYCYHGEKGTTAITAVDVKALGFADHFWVDGQQINSSNIEDAILTPGDVLTFPVVWAGTNTMINFGGEDIIEKHWSINIKANDYVKDAYFDTSAGNVVVNVELAENLDDLDDQEIKLHLYIADNYKGKVQQSQGLRVELPFDNETENYVSFDFTNDADYTAKWVVEKNKKGTAVFDFSDDVYFTVKMVPSEKVILNLSTAYDKDIDKEYNEYDADLSFYNFKGESDSFTKTGELFIPSSKDNKFIYEVVDGELVEVEAEYSSSYKVAGMSKKGYVIETKDLGYYVVADDELVVEEVEDTDTTTPATPDKTNPSTGANDFVGAAVALAVVSVAAAGALAFKK